MIRERKATEINVPEKGGAMTERETALRNLGVQLAGTGVSPNAAATLDLQSVISTFSGYGTFTPITIRSYTMPEKHAHLERNR